MHDAKTREAFAAEHHVLLFAWIAREAIVPIGEEEAAPVMRAAVRLYGEQLVYHGGFEGTLVHEEAQRDQEKRMLPWSYHTAHLYSTMSTVLQRELGSVGVAVLQAALETFAERFGPDMAGVLAGDAGTDFDVLPEGR